MTTGRDKTVTVRMSVAEYERIAAAADRVGLKVSQYLRSAALEKAERQP